MRDARHVEPQLFQPDIPVRLDMRTAALVEHALALQEMAGTGAAALFLHCHDVPLTTALRSAKLRWRQSLSNVVAAWANILSICASLCAVKVCSICSL